MNVMIAFLKKKDGLSFEEFKTYYETRHLALVVRLFDGLVVEHARYYVQDLAPNPDDFADVALAPVGADDYDVVSVYTYASEAAAEKLAALLSQPEISDAVIEDELNFFDRAKCKVGNAIAVKGKGWSEFRHGEPVST